MTDGRDQANDAPTCLRKICNHVGIHHTKACLRDKNGWDGSDMNGKGGRRTNSNVP